MSPRPPRRRLQGAPASRAASSVLQTPCLQRSAVHDNPVRRDWVIGAPDPDTLSMARFRRALFGRPRSLKGKNYCVAAADDVRSVADDPNCSSLQASLCFFPHCPHTPSAQSQWVPSRLLERPVCPPRARPALAPTPASPAPARQWQLHDTRRVLM